MTSHALISSHNPLSKQRPAPCMTIRLTPQILSQLNQNPPPNISFCIKDRVLTIANVRHPLQAFVEDPSLCEVYSFRSERLVQIGNLEHKLIVQREVNAKNTSGSTPKVSESSSAHSNPLAPRQSVSTRAKRPRDSGVNISATKRSVSSNSSTPRRPLSQQSPMEVKSTSPDRQPSSFASNKSSKINSSLPLRDQVIHLLAIQPMSAAGIGRRLSQPTKNLAAILKAVAQYEIPGKYRLRDDLLVNVRIESWSYSEAERNLVLQNIESVLTKPKEGRSQEGLSDLTSLSIEEETLPEIPLPIPKPSMKKLSPPLPETASTRTSPRRSNVHRKHAPVDAAKAQDTQSKASSEICHPPSKQNDNISPIRSHEEYLSCRSRFEQMYPRYSAVDSRLKEIAAEFNALAVKLDSPQCPPAERRKLQQQVKELYSQLKPEVDRLKVEFNDMHEEMSILKSRIRNYVDTVLIPL